MTSKLREQVGQFPIEPGVYVMKNVRDKVVYVGKAKNLRARVRSYFGNSADQSTKTKYLMGHVEQIEYILTRT